MARVLIADDDPIAAAVLGAFLEESGHQVRRARSGAEALRLGRADPPEVLICDFTLRGLDGPSVARRLQAERPRLRIVMTSGHHDALVRRGTDGLRNLRLLPKPLDLTALDTYFTEPAAPPAGR